MKVQLMLDVTVNVVRWRRLGLGPVETSVPLYVRDHLQQADRLVELGGVVHLTGAVPLRDDPAGFATMRTEWMAVAEPLAWRNAYGTVLAETVPHYLAQVAAAAHAVQEAAGTVRPVRWRPMPEQLDGHRTVA